MTGIIEQISYHVRLHQLSVGAGLADKFSIKQAIFRQNPPLHYVTEATGHDLTPSHRLSVKKFF